MCFHLCPPPFEIWGNGASSGHFFHLGPVCLAMFSLLSLSGLTLSDSSGCSLSYLQFKPPP